MNEVLAVRQELHGRIDAMSERNLYALRPLFDVLVDYEDKDDILTADDLADYEECKRDLVEQPENFISLDDYLKTRGIDKRTLTGALR